MDGPDFDGADLDLGLDSDFGFDSHGSIGEGFDFDSHTGFDGFDFELSDVAPGIDLHFGGLTGTHSEMDFDNDGKVEGSLADLNIGGLIYSAMVDTYSFSDFSGAELPCLRQNPFLPEQARKLVRENNLSNTLNSLKEHPERLLFCGHVSGHGRLDAAAIFKQVATATGMLNIGSKTPGLSTKQIDTVYDELLAWDRITPSRKPPKAADMPGGYLPGMTGKTRVFRQYWGVCKYYLLPALIRRELAPPTRHDQIKIEVNIITWSYQQTQDHETRFILRLVPTKSWSRTKQQYVPNEKAFKLYQRAAVQAASGLFEALQKVPPLSGARDLRREMTERIKCREMAAAETEKNRSSSGSSSKAYIPA
ncbi:hypothetical protein GC174_08665 [bacterium]|nr:hypothetical protein [bacterium]